MRDSINRRRFIMSGMLPVSAAFVCSTTHWAHAGNAAEINESDVDQYPGSEPHVSERHDLAGNIDADRSLSLEDLDLLLKLSDWLINKRHHSKRVSAARALGRLGHIYGMPALLSVARDESDWGPLRVECVVALSMIRDKRVVDFLIEEALGNVPNFDGQALSGLVFLVGKPPELHDVSYAGSVKHPPKDPKQREEYLNVWRQWWKNNREKIELGRGGQSIYP